MIEQLEAQIEQGKGQRKPFVLVDLVDLTALVVLARAAFAWGDVECVEAPFGPCNDCDACKLLAALKTVFGEEEVSSDG
jgi:hypothetical protein